MQIKGRRTRTKARMVEEQIEKTVIGRLKPGDALPPQSAICSRFKVGPPTVVSAMKALEQKGLVVRVHGSGTYVTDPSAPTVAVCAPLTKAVEALGERLTRPVRATGARIRHYTSRPSCGELLKEGIRGVLFLAGVYDEEYLRNLTGHGIHVVITDWVPNVRGVDSYNANAYRAAELAVEKLLERGHERIAYVGHHPFVSELKQYVLEPDSELHRTAVVSTLQRRGLKPDESLLSRYRKASPFGRRSEQFTAEDICARLFDRKNPPTAMIVFDMDSVGNHMTLKLSEKGLAVPADISILTLGPPEHARGFCCVGCSLKDLAARALGRLEYLVKAGAVEEGSRVLAEPTYHDGISVAARGRKEKKR